MNRDTLAVLVGAVIAVLAQIVIAPNIAILSAMPNFIAAYVLAIAIVRPTSSTLVLAFVLGLADDLLGNGPVGAMAFLLVLAAFAASRAFTVLNNETLFMPLTILVASMLAIELLYAVILVGLTGMSGMADALVRRAIPCALYDCAAALVFYPLALRFAVAESPLGGSAPAAGPIVGSTAARAASPIVKSTAAPTASPLLRPSAKSKRRR